MSKDLQDTERVYYSIGEVAGMFQVNTSLIRFWEKEFDIIRPHRNKKGNRLFTRRDVDNFHMIYHLVKEKGYTLKGAKETISTNLEATRKEIEVRKTLDKMRDFLLEIKSSL